MNLSSAMISISWFCDFNNDENTSCPYCWVTMAESNRSRSLDHSAKEWLEAIRRCIPETATIDFVGGEPTLFPDFHWLAKEISNSHRWAVTSNMGRQRWKKYKESPLRSCVSWTASYHPSGHASVDEFAQKCLALAPHYPITVNIVDYPSHDAQGVAAHLRQLGLTTYVSPFEDVRSLNHPGATPLCCNGGQSHISIDPQGYTYKCLTQQRRSDQERWRLGNIFDGSIIWPRKRSVCFLPCDQYYTLDRKHSTQDMWGLDVREVEIPPDVDLTSYRETFDAPQSARKNFIARKPVINCVSVQNAKVNSLPETQL
jgi:MoaA/NifB/PqqE/SkfB family radical SAM enzyme